MKQSRSEPNLKSDTAASRMARLIRPPRGTLLNPGVNADFKARHLSVYGRPLMSNRDLRAIEVAELMADWASDESQPDGVREGFPLDSVVGINLAINDFEILSRSHTEDIEDAFTIFAHEWKWRPPVLKAFKPADVSRWEMEVYNILYNYCLRPLEYNSHTVFQFIVWLCSHGSVPIEMHDIIEKERLSGEGIRYSDLLGFVKAHVDLQPEEVQRKKRLAEFFANNKPPTLGVADLEGFDRYKRDVIKICQTNRDIYVLWDEQFVSWLKKGLCGFPRLISSIDRRAFELAIRLDDNRPPTCKDVHLMFGDLLIVMEHYIAREHDRQTQCTPEPLTEQSDDEVELEDMFNEILHNEREIHYQKAEIQKRQAENKGTVDDDRRLQLLDQKAHKCVKMLKELQQAQRRRKIKFEQEAVQRNIESTKFMTGSSAAQMITAQDVEMRKAVLQEVLAPQQYYTNMPKHRPSYPHRPDERSGRGNHDPDYERRQRCRMAEIRRQKLTRRTR
ncbi:hypothetical protein KCU81_g4351, partial [Aureobasidium melanogenum]|uniref:Uncharacterized protein n=1 Tax=Aureobasidium melanogenum (strain CBS 110374) TaxID=1043003 RepID=A0A074VTX8_AURM1